MSEDKIELEIAYIKDSLAEIKQGLSKFFDQQNKLNTEFTLLKSQHDERCDLAEATKNEIAQMKTDFVGYKEAIRKEIVESKDGLKDFKTEVEKLYVKKGFLSLARDNVWKWLLFAAFVWQLFGPSIMAYLQKK